MLRRLPVLRTYTELRAKTAQLESLKTENHELRAKVANVKTLKADNRQLREQVVEAGALRKAVEKSDELLDAHVTPVLSSRKLERILRSDSQRQYREATPFPHIVIEELLHPGILRRVGDEFARMDRSGWKHLARVTEQKFSSEDVSSFGPFTRRVFAELNAGPFVTFLEQLTGINGVISDPHLRGGGLHEILRGGLLGVHADFNYNQRLGIWRRLNLLIYLNTEWNEEWGGHLELWDKECKTCVKRITPTFNRAVIFDTSNFSYHGHPNPLNCPEGHSRRSLALYYYTVDYPYADDKAPHSTVFVETAR